jgi:hypothetical protein
MLYNNDSIFAKKYDRTAWKNFLNETFQQALYETPEPLPNITTDIAKEVFKLGDYTFGGETVSVYEVTLADGIVLERNRVGLRNLLRKPWQGLGGVFIVYHKPESPRWRFTFVSEVSTFDAAGKPIAAKTEPKRYTYVLGEGESVRTAAERFHNLAQKRATATLDDVKEAFSVEKLSDEFFVTYKAHYQNFVQHITGTRLVKRGNAWEEQATGTADAQFASIFNGDKKDVRDFCKKLLGRIVFLYFLQKKGWLGVPPKGSWEEGDKHFLGNLFRDCEHKSIFYSEYLSKLFFDTLNKQRDGDSIELLPGKPCKIPYLNGGLFEEENPKYRRLVFCADLFQNLFNFFDEYNFTIYEDDPNDQTVAVDPEMLGHIFENLLEDNKDKGAYYTPKEIVHYMCQESLIEYLATYFEGKGYTVTTAPNNDFAPNPEQSALFSLNEARKGQMMFEPEVATTAPEVAPANEIDRTLIEKLLKKQLDDRDKEAVLRHAAEFHDALDTVKICDPAIGSGAFPMGLLQEIFATKQMLWLFEHGNTTQFPASDVKRGIIQNSIYGVDIEQGAVDIARLRFWLSLIVDEPVPKPLPNLDYKIVVGNSLVSKLGDEIIDIDWSIASAQEQAFRQRYDDILKKILTKISTKQKLFFSPDGTSESKTDIALSIREMKIELLIVYLTLMIVASEHEDEPKATSIKNKKKFQKATEAHLKTLGWKKNIEALKKLKTKPAEPLHFFDWKLDFPEIMNTEVAEKVGFDIVIGNPPYGAGFTKSEKQFFTEKYDSTKTIKNIQKGSLDSFTIFIELGHSQVKLGGNLHFIVPISITSSDSVTGIHKIMETDCSLIKISSYAVRPQPVFKNAVVNTSILFFRRDGIKNRQILSTKMYRKNRSINLKMLIDNLSFVDIKEFKLNGRYPKISFEIEKAILRKIFTNDTKIRDLYPKDNSKINTGAKIFYRTTGGRYYKVITNYSTGSTKEKPIFFESKEIANLIGSLLSSNLYFWFYQIFSNNLDLKSYEIEEFRVPEKLFDKPIMKHLEIIYSKYLSDIELNSNVRETQKYANIDSFKEYKIGKSKPIIDQIDDAIAVAYCLTSEELLFIKEYELQFRLSDEN